ncbi:hypothetical protein T310_9021, partial [Rasamsonia emersonii CBS 393.64]
HTPFLVLFIYVNYFNPPANNKLCPVIYPVRTSMVTTLATSSGVPSLPSGMDAATSGIALAPGIMPVSPIMAGATSLTLMLNSARRVERLRIMPVRPPLEAA